MEAAKNIFKITRHPRHHVIKKTHAKIDKELKTMLIDNNEEKWAFT